MPQNIAKAHSSFDAAKTRFLNQLKSFSPDKMASKTKDGGWSPLEICEHIIISETGTLGYMAKKTQSGWDNLELAAEDNSESASKLHDALISDRKWKAPDVLPAPKGERSFEEITAQWDTLRASYAQFLDNVDPTYQNRLVFKHPLAGRLDLLQTMDFLTHHILHHMHQLDRAKVEFGLG